MKTLPLDYIRSQFSQFNLGVTDNVKDPLWKGRAKYQTFPLNSGGPHGFFANKTELLSYLDQLIRVSKYQTDEA